MAVPQEAGQFSPEAQARFNGKPSEDIINGASQRIATSIRNQVEALLSGSEHLLLRGSDSMDVIVRKNLEDRIAQRLQDQNRYKETNLTDFKTYEEGRLGGLFNDGRSDKPGIVMYVTEHGRSLTVDGCKDRGYPVLDDQILAVKDGIWEFQFEQGIFIDDDHGGITFSQDASKGAYGLFSEWNLDNKGFRLSQDDVIRVVGTGGGNELWQNIDFTYDGTPREQVAPVAE